MITRMLQQSFGLTEKGSRDVLRAARANFFVFFSMTLAPSLVFFLLSDLFRGQKRALWIYLGLLALILFILFFCLRREYRLSYDVTYEESAALRVRIAEKMRTLPLSYFTKHNLADLSQAVMMDVNNLELTISHALPKLLGFLPFFCLLTGMTLFFRPVLGLALVSPIWLALLLMKITKPLQTRSVRRYYHRLLKNSDLFQEAFEMQKEIKSYELRESVAASVLSALDETESLHLRSEFTMASLSSLIALLPFFSPVLVCLFGSGLLTASKISVLEWIAFLTAASTLSAQFAGINEFILMLFFFRDSFQRLRDLQNEPAQSGHDCLLSSFDIELRDVSFAYDGHEVLRHVCFAAKQGEITAVVGPSGCGKSTLLRLISRLFDSEKGQILIGGRDLRTLSPEDLYRNISVVFQKVELFDDSLLQNIRIGRQDATDEEVMEAARLARADEIAAKLPNGYLSRIGENGSRLSGGERQRISIARAILKNAPILLLDEISSALDIENEREIQKSLQSLVKGKTVLVISHRLRSIERADRIVVLKEGHVEKVGRHEELIKASPTYRHLLEQSEKAAAFRYSES